MTTPADRAPIPYRPAGQVIFETPRLIGRHLVASDANDMFAVYGDAGAMRWVGDGEPLDRDRCVRWIDVTHRNYESRGYGMTALIDRATRDMVGFCGLVHPNGQVEAELKYALRRACWGRGLDGRGERDAGLCRVGARPRPRRRDRRAGTPGLASRAGEGRLGARRGPAQRGRIADPALRVARGAAPEWRLTSTRSSLASRRCGLHSART